MGLFYITREEKGKKTNQIGTINYENKNFPELLFHNKIGENANLTFFITPFYIYVSLFFSYSRTIWENRKIQEILGDGSFFIYLYIN